jgi:hypothetical protein
MRLYPNLYASLPELTSLIVTISLLHSHRGLFKLPPGSPQYQLESYKVCEQRCNMMILCMI